MSASRYLKLADYFDEPNPAGTMRRLAIESGTYVPRWKRAQIKQRRKQGARARCKR